jgi:hypothetical protein
MTTDREGAKASQGAKDHTFFVVSLPENARERDQVATRPTKTLRLFDFVASEGVIGLPPSVFLKPMLFRRWQ